MIELAGTNHKHLIHRTLTDLCPFLRAGNCHETGFLLLSPPHSYKHHPARRQLLAFPDVSISAPAPAPGEHEHFLAGIPVHPSSSLREGNQPLFTFSNPCPCPCCFPRSCSPAVPPGLCGCKGTDTCACSLQKGPLLQGLSMAGNTSFKQKHVFVSLKTFLRIKDLVPQRSKLNIYFLLKHLNEKIKTCFTCIRKAKSNQHRSSLAGT